MQGKTRVITAHVPIALAKKIDKLAQQMERPRGWIVKQALAQWADDEEWKHQGTLRALAQVDSGDVVSHETVKEWIDTLKKPRKKV